MSNSRETKQQETESQRHDEIFVMLADMKVTINELKSKFELYEPVLDYLNKGSIAGKFILGFLKWTLASVITLGGAAGAWTVLKSIIIK